MIHVVNIIKHTLCVPTDTAGCCTHADTDFCMEASILCDVCDLIFQCVILWQCSD